MTVKKDLYPHLRKAIDWFIDYCKRHPKLDRLVHRFALKHEEWQDFRCLGLWRDDIISTEPEIIKEALKRLSQQELDDRNWRIERAIQLSTSGQELPPELHSKLEEDKPYLWKHVEDISRELREKKAFDKARPGEKIKVS